MGRIGRSIERIFFRGIFKLLVWVLLAPFRFLGWLLFSKKRGRYINSNGYVVLTKYDELEHRYIAKSIVDRELQENEVVHHINGVKTDNSVSNLCLMESQKHEHFHAWLSWKKQKSGKYPSVKNQKYALENEYNGVLLDKVNSGNVSEHVEPSDIKVTYDDPKNLLLKLKKLREALATKNDIPLYMVFNNNTLVEMSKKMPVSESEMIQISGVGPVKMRQYGSYFLTEIKSYKEGKGDETT